jgi:hypothetical protein
MQFERNACWEADATTIRLSYGHAWRAFRFSPCRVQNLVDRRFNRRRYDAARTAAAFAARPRDQIELDALSDELLAVVDATVQPTSASLWLRPRPRPGAQLVRPAASRNAQATRATNSTRMETSSINQFTNSPTDH